MVLDILSAFGIPLSISGIIGLLIQAVVTTFAIIIADKVIAHNIEPKHAFIMAIAAFFLTPLLMTGLFIIGIQVSIEMVKYVIPLVVWILLSQLLLEAEAKTKLYVALVAFVVYLILVDIVRLPVIIYSMIGF